MDFRVDEYHIDSSNVRRTPQGGLDVPANLTRTGVFIYHLPDGTTQRELRLPQEVFSSDSLDTLKGAPLTVGHPGIVNSNNWKQLSVGHVGDGVKPSGKFVEARVRVQDKDVVEKVEKKDLVELSCGYTCDVDHTPGTYNGEKYDAIQKNIRYNHVALGAKDFGRAGSEVKLRMDGAGLCVETAGYAKTMELDAALKEIDRLKGELAGASTRADAAEKRVKEINVDVLVADRLALFEDARSVLGDVKLDGKTDKEIMAETCATAFPDLKLDNASEDYLRGLFNAAATQAKLATENVRKGNVTVHADSLEDKVTKARERNDQRSKDAWKGKK